MPGGRCEPGAATTLRSQFVHSMETAAQRSAALVGSGPLVLVRIRQYCYRLWTECSAVAGGLGISLLPSSVSAPTMLLPYVIAAVGMGGSTVVIFRWLIQQRGMGTRSHEHQE